MVGHFLEGTLEIIRSRAIRDFLCECHKQAQQIYWIARPYDLFARLLFCCEYHKLR